MRTLTIIALLISVTLITGCGDPSRPSDLPPLFPCRITITQAGKPLAGATVEFAAADQTNQKYTTLTITDDSGVVQMSTYGHPGAPAGKYKVVVKKIIDGDFVYVKNESTGEQDVVSSKRYRLVEPQFSSAETTPHAIEITGKGKNVEQTFDVGKAVKELVE